MAILDVRRRTGYLFAAVTVIHIVLISAQVNTRSGVPILEAMTLGVFAEVQRIVASGIGGVREGWTGFFALQEVRRENDRLRQEVGQLQVQLQRERAVAQQSRTLQDLLELRQQLGISTAAANVIAGSASAEFRTVTIDKGAIDGLKADMAVIAPAGIVGRVIIPSARAAKVQLLLDRNAAAGGLVERSRAQGIVVGTGTELRMEYVAGSADIKVGDRVVTSGMEGIYPPSTIDGNYPKGFVIGQIESIRRGAGTFSDIVIRPAVDFSSLEAVLVVLTRPSIEGESEKAPESGRGADRRP
jgi:rod shape-determining protein MreC